MLGARMLKTLGCVILDSTDARPASNYSRSFASRPLAGKPLVNWVVRRASEAERLDGVVVILPKDARTPAIEELVPPDVVVFASSGRDDLARLRECLDSFSSEAMVRVQLDSPLIDPCLIDRLVIAGDRDPTIDYATFCSGSGAPTGHSSLGLSAEYFSTSAIRRVDRGARTSRERRDFTRYVLRRPAHFSIRLLPLPEPLDRDDLRLSLRHQDDWDHAEQIVEALGDDGLEWPRIARLLEQQPGLRERMAVMNRAGL
jgi:spore coat polysaccharide biosynthesis protein SpsF